MDRLEDPLGRLEDPWGRLKDPWGRLKDPWGRLKNPWGRLKNPWGRFDEWRVGGLERQGLFWQKEGFRRKWFDEWELLRD